MSFFNNNSNDSGGGKKKRGSNFDHVPADDGFRNYMARKIDLQRKQFGLELPPDPRLLQTNSTSKKRTRDSGTAHTPNTVHQDNPQKLIS